MSHFKIHMSNILTALSRISQDYTRAATSALMQRHGLN